MAIQQIINREFGMGLNENPLQGSYLIQELTDLVEEAVLAEFERLSERGGVLGAMELQYQRSRIQEESLLYELKKDSGEIPIVGVNTFLDPDSPEEPEPAKVNLARARRGRNVSRSTTCAPFRSGTDRVPVRPLDRLKEQAASGGNVFTELMETVRVASLGQITHALYEVGGQYRRAM